MHTYPNWHEVVSQRIKIKGFVVFDFWHIRKEVMETLRRALADGKIKLDNESETVVPTSFEDVPKTWLKLFEGGNFGKLVTKVTE